MTPLALRLVSVTFAAIAIYLAYATWVPGRDGMRNEPGTVIDIALRPNTWREVTIVTAGGARLTCRGRPGWPLAGPNRCPIERFETLVGRTVHVLHDGGHAYEVMAEGQAVVSYADQRTAQVIGGVLAALMLAMSARIGWRK